MSSSKVFYAGSPEQVRHHAAPLLNAFDVEIDSAENILRHATRNDVVVFFSEHFRPARLAVQELKERQIATLYAIDGILEWRNAWENRSTEPASPFTMRPVLSHKVACIGQSQARVLRAWGNGTKVETIGIPRFDHLLNRTPREQENEHRILIMSAKFPGFTESQVKNAIQGFSELRGFLNENPTIGGRSTKPVWRLTQDLAETIGVENGLTDITGAELATVLTQVDSVITTPSTAMLEGMLQGVPVSLLEYNSCPRYVPAAWEINHAGHLSEVIPQLIDPPANKLDLQRHRLRDALECSSPATPRLIQLIEAMLEQSRAAAKQDLPLAFPNHSLIDENQNRELGTGGVDRDRLASLYPNHAETLGTDQTLLPIQLADANRQIQILEEDLAQAKKELSEAHAIFDQIHKHPIAGPVVRIRERILSWLSRRKATNAKESSHTKSLSNDQ